MASKTLSKQVTQRKTEAEQLRDAIQPVRKRILQKMATQLKGSHSPQHNQTDATAPLNDTWTLCLDHLERVTSDLSQADLNHSARLIAYQAALEEREKVLRSTLEQLVLVKETLSGLYGKAIQETLGIAGEIPREPRKLKRWLENLVNNLKSEDFSWPEARLLGKAGHWVEQELLGILDTALQTLSDAMGTVLQRAQDKLETQLRKNELLAAQEHVYSAAFRISEAYCKLAQEFELSKRLRPKTPRTTKRNPAASRNQTPLSASSPFTDAPTPTHNEEN